MPWSNVKDFKLVSSKERLTSPGIARTSNTSSVLSHFFKRAILSSGENCNKSSPKNENWWIDNNHSLNVDLSLLQVLQSCLTTQRLFTCTFGKLFRVKCWSWDGSVTITCCNFLSPVKLRTSSNLGISKCLLKTGTF